MNCEDFESNVNDLAREQILETSVRAQTLAHQEECEACARRLEDERSLSFKLRALAEETNSAPVPPFGDELLTALRNRQAVAIRPARVLPGRYRARFAGVMAVAAMVLIVIGVMVSRLHSVTHVAQNQPKTSGSTSLPPGEAAIVKAPGVDSGSESVPLPNKNSVLEGRRVAGKNRRRNVSPIVVPAQSVADASSKDGTVNETATSVTSDSTTEITTDFMPVGYASATNLQDGGQLVRVELPRSALVAFGLPMNVNRYNETVKADVFFSADGMARAIRFVQ